MSDELRQLTSERPPLTVAEVDLAIALRSRVEWWDKRMMCWRLGRIEKAIAGRVYVMPVAKAETTRCVRATEVRALPGRPKRRPQS